LAEETIDVADGSAASVKQFQSTVPDTVNDEDVAKRLLVSK
jgi:hypothetical protein